MTSQVVAAVGPVLIGLGVLVAALGAVVNLRSVQRRRSWIPVPGRVTESVPQPAGMVLQHIGYRHEGSRRSTSRRLSAAAAQAAGAEVDLLVDPGNPDRAVIVGHTGPRAVGFALMLSGLVAVVVGIVLARGVS